MSTSDYSLPQEVGIGSRHEVTAQSRTQLKTKPFGPGRALT